MIPNGVVLCPPVSFFWPGLAEASYQGRAGPVEPATGVKVMALFKKGDVDGVAPLPPQICLTDTPRAQFLKPLPD